MQFQGWPLAMLLPKPTYWTPHSCIRCDAAHALPSWMEEIWLKEMHIATTRAPLSQFCTWAGTLEPACPSDLLNSPPPSRARVYSPHYLKSGCHAYPYLMAGVDFVSYVIWFSFFLILLSRPHNWTVSVSSVYRLETWSKSKQSNTASVHDITFNYYAWAISSFNFYKYYQIIQQRDHLILTCDVGGTITVHVPDI